MTHTARGRPFLVAVVCLAVTSLAQPALGKAPTPKGSTGGQIQPKTNATVACTRIGTGHVRCTMRIKGGSGISGTVTMRLTHGKTLVALGTGQIKRGKATLTMHLLRKMTPGSYTVSMVITLKATRVLRLS